MAEASDPGANPARKYPELGASTRRRRRAGNGKHVAKVLYDTKYNAETHFVLLAVAVKT
jgi:hypothetical protein